MNDQHARNWGSFAPWLLAATACGEPLSHVETIDKTRILAAKVEVAGDATRAAPLPGEDVRVRWLVVAPDPGATFAYRFEACVTPASASELPSCMGEPLATTESLEPVPTAPTIEFTAPPDATPNEQLAVLGAVCPAESGLVDEDSFACSDGSNAQATTLDFVMDDGSHPNTNPALTGVNLNGNVLSPDTADTTDCAALPSIAPGSGPRRVDLELDPNSRDPLVQIDPSDPARESLLVSYFVTRGNLDHAWSGIDASAPSTNASVVWTPPPEAGEPTLARFLFVVRDGRGGSDFTERRLCVVP